MPVDRTLAQDLADRLAAMYADAERRLAADIAHRLAQGIDAPDWATQKLAGLHRLRLWVAQLLRRLDGQMAAEVEQAVILAFIRGGRAAMDELARLQSTHPEWLRAAEVTDPGPRLAEAIATRTALTAAQLAEIRQALPQIDAVQRLAFSLVSKLRGAHLRITRWAEDAYRSVVGAASADVLLGTTTRRAAAQRAWEQLLTQGITGFTDRAGRNWNLATYVEMATRSTVAQAAVEGHLDRLAAADLDLVIVSDAPGECALCRPWEGKVLSRTGPPGARTVQVPHTLRRSETVTVHIAGSVAEAVLAGLMHPNCRHSLSAFLPGVTRIPTHTEDPEGDEARQQLRHLERRLRAWKLREESVIDPAAHDRAKAKVREYQARIRDHVAATGLIRQPNREQINLGHTTAADAARRSEIREQQRAARAAAEAAERERRKAERAAKRAAEKAAREAAEQAAREAAAKADAERQAAATATPASSSDGPYAERPMTQREAQIRSLRRRLAIAEREADKYVANWEEGLRRLRPDASASERAYYERGLANARDLPARYARELRELETSTDPTLDEIVPGYILRTGTPTVQQAQDHLTQVIGPGFTASDRQIVADEFDRQAPLSTRAAMRLAGVDMPLPGSQAAYDFAKLHGNPNTLAFYRFAGDRDQIDRITIGPHWHGNRAAVEAGCRSSQRSGWWTPSGTSTPLAATLAHEYGHHIATCMWDQKAGWFPPDRVERLLSVINEQLGLRLNVNAMDPIHELTQGIGRNRTTVTSAVSHYGATNAHEMLAEVWQEYSTLGDRARPHIAAIGRVMQDLAQEGAFDS